MSAIRFGKNVWSHFNANVMTLQQVATMLDFDDCWTFSQLWTPLSIIPFLLFLFKMGLAVVLQWRIYWPLLASTCSPLKALACWPNRYILSLSPWCGERNSFFVSLEYIMVQRATAGHQRNQFKGLFIEGSSHASVEQKCGEHLCLSMCEC